MIILPASRASQIRRRDAIEKFVKKAKRAARHGVYNYGRDRLPPEYCHDFVLDGLGVRIIYSRDVGHHTGGWFKNPDYERCYHLSISFRDPQGVEPLPQNHRLAVEVARSFFGEHLRWTWIEHPFTDIGKKYDVWHYRLFAQPDWSPLYPRKEVYSKDFTEKGWKSFSEIHGHAPDMVMAV